MSNFLNPTWMVLSSFISLIGFAVFVYGRKQRMIVPSLVGVAMMAYPYFVSSAFGLLAIGALLIGGLFIGVRYEDSI